MTEPALDFNARSSRLVGYLVHLAEAERRDRAALARLRAALRPDRQLEALPLVMPFIEPREHAENAALLTAGLFALHPNHRRGQSLGAALGHLARRQEGDSVQMRFRALLSCSGTELPTHLRHAVTLVASGDQAVDYVDLHGAIHFWDHEEHRARRRWARDFWAPSSSRTDGAEDGAES